MGFRLVPKSVTLNDLELRSGYYFRYFRNSLAFGAHCVKVVEDIPNFLQQKYSPKLLVFSDVSLAII